MKRINGAEICKIGQLGGTAGLSALNPQNEYVEEMNL
jgi:hypothetical protein